jgi:hypothetical protein
MTGMHTRPIHAAALALVAASFASSTDAATPAQLLLDYSTAAGAPALARRGQDFFTQAHGREWRCASCHGERPTQPGRHAATGKPIAPLAPAVDPQRFTDADKVEKWFRRNCNDVVGRACSAIEKADVLAWLLSLKP